MPVQLWGCCGVVIEYWTCTSRVAVSFLTHSSANSLELANLLYAQANSLPALCGTGSVDYEAKAQCSWLGWWYACMMCCCCIGMGIVWPCHCASINCHFQDYKALCMLSIWSKWCMPLCSVVWYSWFGPYWNTDCLLHHEALQVYSCRSHRLDSDLSTRLSHWSTAGIPSPVSNLTTTLAYLPIIRSTPPSPPNNTGTLFMLLLSIQSHYESPPDEYKTDEAAKTFCFQKQSCRVWHTAEFANEFYWQLTPILQPKEGRRLSRRR